MELSISLLFFLSRFVVISTGNRIAQPYPLHQRMRGLSDGKDSSSDSEDSSKEEKSDSSSSDSQDSAMTANGGVPPEWIDETTDWGAYEPGQLDCNLYRTVTAKSGSIEFKEVVDPLQGTVTIEMVYAGLGWLSIGMASNGKMVGNTVVMGLPDEPVGPLNPAKYRLADEAKSGVNLLPMDQQTLQNVSIAQNETHTWMRFTQLLQEDGEREILAAPQVNTAIYAIGKRNELSMHTHDGAFSIMLTNCLKPDQDPSLITTYEIDALSLSSKSKLSNSKTLWMCHGILMAIGWGVLVPLAIGASIMPKVLPSKITWASKKNRFQWHRGLNIAAMLCISIGFILAVVADGGEMFEEWGEHPSYGWWVFVMAVFQTFLGVFRPPASKTLTHKSDETIEGEENHGVKDNQEDLKDEQNPIKEPAAQKTILRKIWEVSHRAVGFGTLALAWFTVHTGLGLFEERYEEGEGLETFFWVAAAGISGTIVVGTIAAKFSVH